MVLYGHDSVCIKHNKNMSSTVIEHIAKENSVVKCDNLCRNTSYIASVISTLEPKKRNKHSKC